jgi:hypothetical protein
VHCTCAPTQRDRQRKEAAGETAETRLLVCSWSVHGSESKEMLDLSDDSTMSAWEQSASTALLMPSLPMSVQVVTSLRLRLRLPKLLQRLLGQAQRPYMKTLRLLVRNNLSIRKQRNESSFIKIPFHKLTLILLTASLLRPSRWSINSHFPFVGRLRFSKDTHRGG